MREKRYWILAGTRREAIKQIPLYLELVRLHGRESVALISTGQHRELLEQVFHHFHVRADANLDIMRHGQGLTESSASILQGMNTLLRLSTPEWLIVQGDTTSASMAALAGFQHRVKIAHNEAGLRSYDLEHPFPEEGNRRLISGIASLHFAPTVRAKDALMGEGITEDSIHITGNTGIDALRWTLERPRPQSIDFVLRSIRSKGLRPVLLTAHRRENSTAMDDWFRALAHFLRLNSHLGLIYPLHPNHLARAAAEKHLTSLPQAHLIAPLNYAESCHLLSECEVVVTDSSGLQEEAATLGIPTVICRKITERMEAVDQGLARLAGTDADSILSALAWAVTQKRAPKAGLCHLLYGDGQAAQKIGGLL
ncbi:UDP-N-acetylglucosamine 2-epimerase (non-hydrolyzing) [bacterium]|nr:UDP-N-acetylglucosamine 2-epimerase (non-hydrolyzing) [bacterium]